MSMKKYRMGIKMFAVCLFMGLLITAIPAKADVKSWTLQYGGGLPTNVYITSKTVSGTMSSYNKITAKVTSFSCSGNGWVHLSTNKGGMSSFVNCPTTVLSPNKVAKGTSVKGTAAITNPTSLNSCFSSGRFDF